MTAPEGYSITVSDPRLSSDEEIAEGWELNDELREEFFPEEPRSELSTVIASMRSVPARFGMWRVRVRDADGRLVGGIRVSKDWDNDTNPEVGGVEAHVRAGHRGRGIGTALLAWQVAFSQALGVTRLLMHTDSRLPGSAELAAALGGERKTQEHENRLAIADVDPDLLRRWIDDAQGGDYELLFIEGPVPDALAQPYVDLVLVMNTAPRDDLQVNDFTFSVTELREQEAQEAAVGGRSWIAITRHRTTGELVGVHTLYFPKDHRDRAYVGITGVVPEHRGHRLGRWLKADLTARVLEQCPQVRMIITGNADSNGPMLAINRDLGYRPHAAAATWEVSREQLEKVLQQRGVEVPTAEAAAAVASQAPATVASQAPATVPTQAPATVATQAPATVDA